MSKQTKEMLKGHSSQYRFPAANLRTGHIARRSNKQSTSVVKFSFPGYASRVPLLAYSNNGQRKQRRNFVEPLRIVTADRQTQVDYTWNK